MNREINIWAVLICVSTKEVAAAAVDERIQLLNELVNRGIFVWFCQCYFHRFLELAVFNESF